MITTETDIMEKALYLLTAFVIFMMGASIFSFLNVVAYRTVKGEGFIKGRSYCPDCGHDLGVFDLVPVFSYIFLGGKCRYCQKHISIQDTVFEMLGGFLLLGAFYKALSSIDIIISTNDADIYIGLMLRVILTFSFFSVMDVISLIDVATMEIKNGHVIVLAFIGAAALFIMPEISLVSRLIGMVAVSVPMLIIALIVPGGFGGGDIKMMAPVGFMLGWKLTLVGTFLAILAGGIWGAFLLLTRRAEKKSHFAFGPFLCAGMAVSYLFGDLILNAYLGLFYY